jgi:hypothetical protein
MPLLVPRAEAPRLASLPLGLFLFGFLFGLLSSGCASAPAESAAPAPHVHRITTTVSVTDDALLPHADVRIPDASTIVWRNRGSAPLHVDIDIVTCGGCETVMGFHGDPKGAHSTDIAPGAIATICFHQLGTFGFTARIGDHEHRGTITVTEAP